MEWVTLQDGALIAVLLVCMVTDIKSRLIYNNVIFPALAAAFLLQLLAGGFAGLLQSAAGMAVGLSILLIPYLLGGMGAGDVKLLALVGAFKGVMFVLITAVYMSLIGALMAAASLLLTNSGRKTVQWTAYYIAGLRQGIRLPVFVYGNSVSHPYGVAIGLGAIAAWLPLSFGGGLLW
jgi:prepilin peptidase CpaA